MDDAVFERFEEWAQRDICGWHADAMAGRPGHDPGRDAPCPFCGQPIGLLDSLGVITATLEALEGTPHNYFFRLHSYCFDVASVEARKAVGLAVANRIEAARGLH